MLSSFILLSDGEIDNFEQVATMLIDDPAILNLLIAPDGVVTEVYPKQGNEAVIGLDFFSDGAGNKEAAMAKETGALVLGGPFDAVQGGQILVGRMPVYTNNPDGSQDFWGLVSVTLKFPDVFNAAGLDELELQGYTYEIWRINPDSNERQVVADSTYSRDTRVGYVEKQLAIKNSLWHFQIAPFFGWYKYPETWVTLFISLCVSLLVGAMVQNNVLLKIVRDRLEALSNADALTGIYNRRFFMESAAKQMDRLTRASGESFIIMFDLDHFKKINDVYGHPVGDAVLKGIAARISDTLRSYDLFARYGGEEFIILATDIDEARALCLAERVRLAIALSPIEVDDKSISITASLGIAPAAAENGLDAAIALADNALYQAKATRNNCVLFKA